MCVFLNIHLLFRIVVAFLSSHFILICICKQTHTYLVVLYFVQTHFPNTIIVILSVSPPMASTQTHTSMALNVLDRSIYCSFARFLILFRTVRQRWKVTETVCIGGSGTSRSSFAMQWRRQSSCRGKFELPSFQCFSFTRVALLQIYWLTPTNAITEWHSLANVNNSLAAIQNAHFDNVVNERQMTLNKCTWEWEMERKWLKQRCALIKISMVRSRHKIYASNSEVPEHSIFALFLLRRFP